MAIAPIIFSKC